MRYYLYPSLTNLGFMALNPFMRDFFRALSKKRVVVNSGYTAKHEIVDLLKESFSANVYIFNWIENTSLKRFGRLQSLVFLYLIIPILKVRKVKIYWVFHNLQPHQGKTQMSEKLKLTMMKQSDLIITFSREALEYIKQNSNSKSIKLFAHHPTKIKILTESGFLKKYDILIWGRIEPYKGIVEFLEFLSSAKSTLSIKIIGRCENREYSEKIYSLLSPNISFENRIVPIEELKLLISHSSYVVFPYLKDSISSSGAVIDTIYYGGTSIGPNNGAFWDLKNDGVCYTFNQYEDILKIVKSGNHVPLDKINNFLDKNTWDKFIEKVITFE